MVDGVYSETVKRPFLFFSASLARVETELGAK